jgi:hypothetical protein
MKKTAILINGEWFRRCLETALKGLLPHGVTADVMYKNALLAPAQDEELYRLFYYDCPPYQGKETNPIDKATVDFKSLKKFQSRSLFLSETRGSKSHWSRCFPLKECHSQRPSTKTLTLSA